MSRNRMNDVPDQKGGARAGVAPGEFGFAASHFDHAHIYGQIAGLSAAGGTLKAVYEPDAVRLESVCRAHPGVRVARDFAEILESPDIHLVTAAAIPDQRAAIGIRVMEAGKDYLTDKAPFTTFDQLGAVRACIARTGRKYMVCYSERLCNEASWHAGELLAGGAIGRVLQVLNLSPHNLAAASRPSWFFEKARYGGILTDIGSHQFEQFLTYAGAGDATVNHARVENFAHPETPGLEDFGEATLTLDNGAAAYCRVDWLNPGGSKVWGDGRTFVLGTRGYLEIRKVVDLGRDLQGDRILLVDETDTHVIECRGRIGAPFFGRLILDVLNRTETAMTQAHALKAGELALRAQQWADEHRQSFRLTESRTQTEKEISSP